MNESIINTFAKNAIKIYANVEMALIRTAYPPFASATQIPVCYAIVLYMLGEIFGEKMT